MAEMNYPMISPSTSPFGQTASARGVVVGALLFCMAGTGGSMSPEALTARNAMGYRIPLVRYSEAVPVRTASRRQWSASECLASIKKAFALSMTEVAAIFGTSRQAVYNWQAGNAISDVNMSKLSLLNEAAGMLKELGIEPSVARRKLPGGQTTVQAIMSGIDPVDAVNRLQALILGERSDRAQLVARSRAGATLDFSEAGIRLLDERG